jgi:hypothetical protein
MTKVAGFKLHNNRGQSVLHTDLLEWKDDLKHPSGIFGPVIKRSWFVGEQCFESERAEYWRLLPDSSGFIAFENTKRHDNCLLLDAYGKERMRLSVPWQMTGATDPAAQAVSEFDNVSEPYNHPETHQKGQFGVTGWVGEAKYYFELDFQTGQFFWCRHIRD